VKWARQTRARAPDTDARRAEARRKKISLTGGGKTDKQNKKKVIILNSPCGLGKKKSALARALPFLFFTRARSILNTHKSKVASMRAHVRTTSSSSSSYFDRTRGTRVSAMSGGRFLGGNPELFSVAPLELSKQNDTLASSLARASLNSALKNFPVLVFFGDAEEETTEDTTSSSLLLSERRLRQRGLTMFYLGKDNDSASRARILVLTPALIEYVNTSEESRNQKKEAERDGRPQTTNQSMMEPHSTRLVQSLFPDFEVLEVSTMLRRSLVVIDSNTWVILIGVEPWQFGVYKTMAEDISDASRIVVQQDGSPNFSLRDTKPLYDFGRKRRVDVLLCLLERHVNTISVGLQTQVNDYKEELQSVDETLKNAGLIENPDEPLSNRLLKQRERRKLRKLRKRAKLQELKREEEKAEGYIQPSTREKEQGKGSVDDVSGEELHTLTDIEDLGNRENIVHCQTDTNNPVGNSNDTRAMTDTEAFEINMKKFCDADSSAASLPSSLQENLIKCGDCEFASTCDRKRKIESILREGLDHKSNKKCAFEYREESLTTETFANGLSEDLSISGCQAPITPNYVHDLDDYGNSTSNLDDKNEGWKLVTHQKWKKKRIEMASLEVDAKDIESEFHQDSFDKSKAHQEGIIKTGEVDESPQTQRIEALIEENELLKAELEKAKIKREKEETKLLSKIPRPKVLPMSQEMSVVRSFKEPKESSDKIPFEKIARCGAIFSIVNHWFSVENIMNDHFLRAQMDPSTGYIVLQILCSFRSLVNIGVTQHELAEIISHSPLLELNDEKDRCRMRNDLWRTFVLNTSVAPHTHMM